MNNVNDNVKENISDADNLDDLDKLDEEINEVTKIQILKYSILINFISWGIFTFFDFLDEHYIEYSGYNGIFIFAMPVIIGILYFVLRFKGIVNNVGIKKRIINFLIWILTSGVISSYISFLALGNSWIVHQNTGGWENFLNGIEYPFFGFLLIVITLVLFIISDIICFIIYRKRREEH